MIMKLYVIQKTINFLNLLKIHCQDCPNSHYQVILPCYDTINWNVKIFLSLKFLSPKKILHMFFYTARLPIQLMWNYHFLSKYPAHLSKYLIHLSKCLRHIYKYPSNFYLPKLFSLSYVTCIFPCNSYDIYLFISK
jgi:hypothetical protein